MVLGIENLLPTLREAKEAEGYAAIDVFDAEALDLIDDCCGYGSTQLIMVSGNKANPSYVKITSDGEEAFVTPGTTAFTFE